MSELHVWMRTPVYLMLGLSLMSLSCGGDEDDGLGDVCANVTPCGGDPVGTWQGEAFCGDFTALIESQGLPAGCEGALTVEDVTVDTTLIISDTSWSENGNIIFDWNFDLDSTCIGALAGQSVDAAQISTFCDAFAPTLMAQPDYPFDDMTCAVSGNTCRCSATQTEPVDTATAITVEGSNIVEAGGASSGFCQAGDELSIQAVVPTGGSLAIVYTRAP